MQKIIRIRKYVIKKGTDRDFSRKGTLAATAPAILTANSAVAMSNHR
jgi:hypothetical protein